MLKTIGFGRAQVFEAVAWQATTLAAVGLVVGVPAGIAVGRWGWRAFVSELGAVPAPSVPVAIILAAAIGTLLLANIVAALPARSAGRTPAASVLRAE